MARSIAICVALAAGAAAAPWTGVDADADTRTATRTPTCTVTASPTPTVTVPPPSASPQPAWLALTAIHQQYPYPARDILKLMRLTPGGGNGGQIGGNLDIVGGSASVLKPNGFACTLEGNACYVVTQDSVGPAGPINANIYTIDPTYGSLISSMQLPNVTAAGLFIQAGTWAPLVLNVSGRYANGAGGLSVLRVTPTDGGIETLVQLGTDTVPDGYEVRPGGAAYCGSADGEHQRLWLQPVPIDGSADTSLVELDLKRGEVKTVVALDWPRGFNAMQLRNCTAAALRTGTGPVPYGLVYTAGNGTVWPSMAYGRLETYGSPADDGKAGPGAAPRGRFVPTTPYCNTVSCGPPCPPSGFITTPLPGAGADWVATFSQGANPSISYYFGNATQPPGTCFTSRGTPFELYGASLMVPAP